MTKRPYPDGGDCVWLARDKAGHVAAFVTGGAGPVPAAVLDSGECDIEEIEGRIRQLPQFSGARLLVQLKRPDDFIAIAQRGIFAYDWSDVHRTEHNEISAYELIAAPVDPIKIFQLPLEVASLAMNIKIESVIFETTKVLDVRETLNCVEGA